MRLRVTFTQERACAGVAMPFLRRVIREAVHAGAPMLAERPTTVQLSVASVSLQAITSLNADYRAKPQATDVLSFGNYNRLDEILAMRAKTIDIGQIVFAPDYIRRSAQEDGVSWKHEWVFVIVHGVLHLLGYDHGQGMFEIQDRVTESLVRSGR